MASGRGILAFYCCLELHRHETLHLCLLKDTQRTDSEDFPVALTSNAKNSSPDLIDYISGAFLGDAFPIDLFFGLLFTEQDSAAKRQSPPRWSLNVLFNRSAEIGEVVFK